MTWTSKLTDLTQRMPAVALCYIVMLCNASFAQNVNAPTWNAIEQSGDEVNYFAYYDGAATEIAQSAGFGGSATHSQLLSTSRPPIYYTVFGGSYGVNARGVCQITNQPSKPIYWYSDGTNTATATAGGYFPAPSDAFSVSTSLSSTKGLEFRGAFDGSGSVSSGGYMVETVFLSDRPCTDGGLEYGFFRRVWNSTPSDTIAFYYSDFTNCDGGICRATNSNTPTTNVENPNPIEHDITSLPVTNSGGTDDQWIFHAYPVWTGSAWDMRFEILDPYTLGYAQCKVDGSGLGDCYKEYTPSDWSESFGQFSGLNAYVFSVTQSVGTVTQSPDFILHVEALNIGN